MSRIFSIKILSKFKSPNYRLKTVLSQGKSAYLAQLSLLVLSLL
ncbi:hypothetical protein HHE06_13310 [Helicobacter heilmannii]|nr:hypothetical protein HHE06_13310 [Helicobacter heilmannii]